MPRAKTTKSKSLPMTTASTLPKGVKLVFVPKPPKINQLPEQVTAAMVEDKVREIINFINES